MADRDRNLRPLRAVLGEVTGRLGIDRAAETGVLWSRWRSIVGDVVADHAEPTSLRRGMLSVRVETPAWASEIGYLADEIKTRANAALGAEVVREIRLQTGSIRSPRRARERGPSAVESAPTEAIASVGDESSVDPTAALERARRAWATTRSKRR